MFQLCMTPGYNACKQEKGKDSFKRMQAVMVQFTDDKKVAMFTKVVRTLEDDFDALQVEAMTSTFRHSYD